MRHAPRTLWLSLCLAACGGGSEAVSQEADAEAAAQDAGEDAAVQTPIMIELGSGEASFEPVGDPEPLKLYAGTQGGHHVWLSFRVQGLAPDDVRMTLDVVPAPPARPAHSDVTLDLEPVQGDEHRYEFVGWPARILDPECAVGTVVSISLTLTDEHGEQVSAAMDVIPQPPTLGFTRSCML